MYSIVRIDRFFWGVAIDHLYLRVRTILSVDDIIGLYNKQP
jgi:hypothetical protein